jgi:ubiquinone/menaquinone biosynthesis C-methylase UbiE
MSGINSIYESSRLAAGYAYGRPPVHQHIIQRVREYFGLNLNSRFRRALDVGCGSGLSTVVLESLAETLFGLEPVGIMLTHRHKVAPHALFLVGKAEMLPFSSGAFDLITAAGSLNYAEVDLFLSEVKRVLAPNGVLLVYDFDAGRRILGDCRLEEWFTSFQRRYPSPLSDEFDARYFAYHKFGLQLREFEKIEVTVPMTFKAYMSYIMSQTNVEWAISHGEPETEIHSWCWDRIAELFRTKSQDVIFPAYIAYVIRSNYE